MSEHGAYHDAATHIEVMSSVEVLCCSIHHHISIIRTDLPKPEEERETMYPSCFLVLSSAKSGSPISERRIIMIAALRGVVLPI